ncbi:hypothetical protein DNTS_030379 [Danionella cerebrum]|uniref:TNFR-Cys domain-containing protein n=1 Tax=Danionella cerebrum TaxID=2873325 RepID=A0A553QWE6_9TELE|nr:hypothetical protein DNTS_030379 [Danionella translucida]
MHLKTQEDSKMPMTVVLITMMTLTGLLVNGLPMDGKARDCSSSCSAGYYMRDCQCIQCSPGFFTSRENKETKCFRCFQGCIIESNMEKVKNCTTSSDVVCRCREGFTCTVNHSVLGHCDKCDPIPTSSPSQLPFPSSTSSNRERPDSSVVVRQCSMVAEVYSESQSDELHAQEILSHDKPDVFHQPAGLEPAAAPAGNLGPLHIYGPQTVFVHFVGEEKALGIKGEAVTARSESFPQSPVVNLSQEEKSEEDHFQFFPSQEQGKECHISKEEVL